MEFALVAAREEGRRQEREDAVALLSGGRTPGGEAITSARHAAEVIRRGDHVGAAAGKVRS